MRALSDPSLLKSCCYVAGRWYPENSRDLLTVRNPATGERIADIPVCGAAETRGAISAAQQAFPAWRALTAAERGRRLRRWFELMLEHREDLALLMTAEQGKPLAEAQGEIGYAASFLEWFAEEGKRTYGDLIPSPHPDRRILVLKEPVGVCAAITPWNFPAAMITRKAAAALAAGCTLVGKPAEQTPLSALALAELSARAGIPPGVFNVVCGDPVVIGAELTEPGGAQALLHRVHRGGAAAHGPVRPTLKRLSLELGGNAPFIVFDDADLESAVVGALASKYRNSGQTCVCANRFLVQAGIYEAFAAGLSEAVGTLKVGNGLEADVSQGPLIDQAAVSKVEELVADAVGKGARVVGGGRRHALGGTFYEPTILADLTPRCAWPGRRSSVRWPRCSASPTSRRRSPWPTTPSTAWPLICTPGTWAASGGSARPWSTAWWGSTRGSSRPRWHPSGESKGLDSGGRAPAMGSRNTSRSST